MSDWIDPSECGERAVSTDSDRTGERLPERLILFDGVCGFCIACVRWIICNDPSGNFHFAPLQSPTGRHLCQEAGLDADDFDTFLYVKRGEPIWLRSDAALAVARDLGGVWSLLGVLRLIPRPIRDAAYHALATKRYRWFGRRESCALPPDFHSLKSRFRLD